MSASLVGSEMCIRDRSFALAPPPPASTGCRTSCFTWALALSLVSSAIPSGSRVPSPPSSLPCLARMRSS
eukprot:12719039-Alexandrium_andersonii.AAC.1